MPNGCTRPPPNAVADLSRRRRVAPQCSDLLACTASHSYRGAVARKGDPSVGMRAAAMLCACARADCDSSVDLPLALPRYVTMRQFERLVPR